jgi:hypothetical protein
MVMALKSLIASKASLAEDAIEKIIANFTRFDVDERAIVFTPEAHGLSIKAKILIYLVALQGWPYVVDQPVPADAKPADIGEDTGIPGNTLRPILKELKDRNVIVEQGGRYSVRAVALHAIKSELGGAPSQSRPKKTRRKSKSTAVEDAATDKQSAGGADVKRVRRSSGLNNLAERFNELIEGDFFDKWKTLGDVQRQFHKEGIIVPQSSIPPYLLKEVRSRPPRLERDKHDVNGKNVWVYKRKH